MRKGIKELDLTKEFKELDNAMDSLEKTIAFTDKLLSPFITKEYDFKGIKLTVNHHVDEERLKSSEYQSDITNPYFPFKFIIEGLFTLQYVEDVNHYARYLYIMVYCETIPELNGWGYLQIENGQPYFINRFTNVQCLLDKSVVKSLTVLVGTDVRVK